jgi:Cytochrome c
MQQTKRRAFYLTAAAALLSAIAIGTARAESAGKGEFLANCARCHGTDGKGKVATMRAVPGYVSIDLTRLSKENGGKFPRQEVEETIEGSKRFPAHLVGDMPAWGLRFRNEPGKSGSEKEVKHRIAALRDYIESIQE